MRKSERRAKAWESLLSLALKENSIQIYYRGINEKQEPLYELKTSSGVYLNKTEGELIKMLQGGN